MNETKKKNLVLHNLHLWFILSKFESNYGVDKLLLKYLFWWCLLMTEKKCFSMATNIRKAPKKSSQIVWFFQVKYVMKKIFNSQIFLNNSEFFLPLLRRTYEVWCPKGKHKFTFPDLAFEFCLKFCYTTSTTLPDFVGKLYKIPYWVKELNF